MKKFITLFLLSFFFGFISLQSYAHSIDDPKEETVPILGDVVIYPNPVTESATVTFTLSKTEPVTIEIYSLIGQKVATLAKDQLFSTGTNTIVLHKDALKLTSSLYLLSITCEGKTKNYKLFVR